MKLWKSLCYTKGLSRYCYFLDIYARSQMSLWCHDCHKTQVLPPWVVEHSHLTCVGCILAFKNATTQVLCIMLNCFITVHVSCSTILPTSLFQPFLSHVVVGPHFHLVPGYCLHYFKLEVWVSGSICSGMNPKWVQNQWCSVGES